LLSLIILIGTPESAPALKLQDGYLRKDGTYVRPHLKSGPNNTPYDNLKPPKGPKFPKMKPPKNL
jgi:hypothetical protein